MEQNESGYSQPITLYNQTKAEDNVSQSNEQSHKYYDWVNYAQITASIISICCNITALIIITNCQRMPLSVRYLSANFISCFLAVEVVVSLHSLAMLMFIHILTCDIYATFRPYRLFLGSLMAFYGIFILIVYSKVLKYV